jgi:hypothetical protein
MKRFLHLKHWQLFFLLFGIPLFLQLVFIVNIFMTQNAQGVLIIFPVIMTIYTGIYFVWFYALGTNLNWKLPLSVNMNLKRFKIFLLIPFVYNLVFSFFIFFAGFNRIVTNGQPANIGLMGLTVLIIPIHLFSMFCIFYCLYFVAKSLKTVESQKPVIFGDFAGEFFLIWFFPIGVWIIQPRINRLFSDHEEMQSAS